MNLSWDIVFEKNIVEFLNVLCYVKDKRELEYQKQKEFQNKLKNKRH